MDEDTGDEAGTTEGVFVSRWQGDILYGQNEAVGGHYVLAYGTDPRPGARRPCTRSRPACCCGMPTTTRMAGSFSFRWSTQPFYVPLALPGDDITPERFVCFRFLGRSAVSTSTPTSGTKASSRRAAASVSLDKQGAVHARVSVDFAREFGCLVECLLPGIGRE